MVAVHDTLLDNNPLLWTPFHCAVVLLILFKDEDVKLPAVATAFRP
nr:hypothetical protein [Tetragenococcus halophilus]